MPERKYRHYFQVVADMLLCSYQEYQLAYRLLIFASNKQVYLVCDEAVFSEDVITGPMLDTDAPLLHGAATIKVRPDPSRRWSAYRRMVEMNTRHDIINQADILDACTGILTGLYGGRHTEGIPIALLQIALLWQPRRALRRRRGFPTWS